MEYTQLAISVSEKVIPLYEDLRSEVLHLSEGYCLSNQGLALFLHQGMLGWLRAWSKCSHPTSTARERRGHWNDRNLPAGLRAEVATLLANMALESWKEAATV